MTDTTAEGVAETAAKSGLTDEAIAELVGQAEKKGLALTGPGGLLTELTKKVLEASLEGEMTGHVGHEAHDPEGRNGANSRNGHRVKTVLTEAGPVELRVPPCEADALFRTVRRYAAAYSLT